MLKKIIVMIIISLSCSIGYANNLSESNTVIIVDNTPKVVVKLAPAAVQNSGIAAQYLRKKAPIDYIVKKNDTVVGIAQRYLSKIGLWPKLLGVSSLSATKLYPGDALHLVSLDGNKILLVDHANVLSNAEYEKLEPAVHELNPSELPAISTKLLRNLFTHPTVMPPQIFESLPKVIGGSNPGQFYYTTGDTIYIKGFIGQTGDRVTIYSKFRKIIDPDSQEDLGNEVRFDGDGIVTQSGPVSIVSLTNAVNQITDLDRVSPFHEQIIPEIIPHSSDQIITGKIVGLYDAITSTAEDNSVVINRGSRDGVDVGQVYDITDTHKIVDPDSNQDNPRYLVMPPQVVGEMIVYKVYDKISFGLITDSSQPINFDSVVQSQ